MLAAVSCAATGVPSGRVSATRLQQSIREARRKGRRFSPVTFHPFGVSGLFRPRPLKNV